MIEPTDEMIYAFAGEPEITATDAYAIRVGLAAVLAIVERDHLSVMAKLVDPDPCSYDHHGDCQAHGSGSERPCPHARAKELLGHRTGA